MANNYNRDTKRAALIQETAHITGVSVRSVRRVLDNQQRNEDVIAVYMTLLEGMSNLQKQVRQLVPFYEEVKRKPRPDQIKK